MPSLHIDSAFGIHEWAPMEVIIWGVDEDGKRNDYRV